MKYDFTFTLTEEDVYTFNKFHIRNSPSGRRTINRLRIFLPAMLVLLAAVNSLMSRTRVLPMVISGVLIVLWFVFFGKFIDWSVRRGLKRVRRDGSLCSSKEVFLSFDENGMVEMIEGGNGQTDYSIFERVAYDEYGVYLYNSAMTARVIPTRAFSSAGEKEQFIQFLNARI